MPLTLPKASWRAASTGEAHTSAPSKGCSGDKPAAAQTRLFGELWQDRVRRLLLDHADDPAVVEVRRLA